jgi:hypothetical protein
MKTKLNILKAHHGDSIIIETYDSSNNIFTILIDGGPRETFRTTLVHELEYFFESYFIDNERYKSNLQYCFG